MIDMMFPTGPYARRNLDLENASIYLHNLSIKDHEIPYYFEDGKSDCDLAECAKLTSEGIKQIPNSVIKLNLRALPRLSSDCISSIALLTNLVCLNLSQNCFSFEELHRLSALPNLKVLHLWQCRTLEDQNLAWLKEKKLTSLDISYCNQLTDACLPFLTNILSICLDGLNYITTEGVLQLRDSSEELLYLSLERCPEVDKTQFCSYFRNYSFAKRKVRIHKVSKKRALTLKIQNKSSNSRTSIFFKGHILKQKISAKIKKVNEFTDKRDFIIT